METRANYVLIGAFTLLTAIGLLLFGLWAAKFSSERSWQQYKIVFDESVAGLSVGSPVQFNGIAVGSIQELSLDPNDPRRAIAIIRADARAPVKTDTRARMAITSVTGPSIIQLTGGSPGTPRLVDVDKRDPPVILTSPSALQNIADTANRLVERLDVVLSEANVDHISATLENLERISGALAQQDKGVEALLVSARDAARNLDRTLDTTNGMMQKIDGNVVQKLPPLLDKLDTTLARLDSAAGNADAILGENRAAISSFSNDGLAQLGPTLSELRGLTRDLRQVSDRLQGNPARYLLGRDAPKEFDPK